MLAQERDHLAHAQFDGFLQGHLKPRSAPELRERDAEAHDGFANVAPGLHDRSRDSFFAGVIKAYPVPASHAVDDLYFVAAAPAQDARVACAASASGSAL